MKTLHKTGILFLLLFNLSEVARAIPIGETKFTGIPLEQVETIRNLSGILLGDEYDKVRAEHAAEKIRNYYEGKGYPQAEVLFDLSVIGADRHALLFNIKLGVPIRIAAVDFISKDISLSSDLITRLNQLIALQPGELFDRDRIKEMRRTIETGLIAQNFIDSRVADITNEVTALGLKLTFVLELGQKVILSVSGNANYTRSELMNLVETQRAQGLGRDYVAVIVGRLRDYYVDHGFRQVKVIPYSFEPHGNEPKKVVFDIDEGPLVHLKTVTFDGNETFTHTQLEEFFFLGAESRIIARIYNEKMVEDAAKRMIDELKKRGYLSAKLIALKTEEIPKSNDLSVKLFVSEGTQTKIQAIDFHGNDSFTPEKLDNFLGLHEGDPLNLVQLEDGIDRIKKEYRNLGKLQFKINNEGNDKIVTYSEKNQFAYLNFDLDEGPVLCLAKFDIFGNETTKRKVIEREIRIKVGEPLAENKVLELEESLRRLGIFSQVNVDFKESETVANAKNMKIQVQEAVPGSSDAGIGFRNDLGIRVFGELAYANLWGLNQTAALDVTANRRINDFRFTEYSATMGYTMPWALLGETTFRPSITAEKRQYLEFDAQTFAFSAGLDRMFYKPLRLSGSFTYTLEQVTQFDAIDKSQNQTIRIGSITPTLRIDLRDNPLAPKSGFFALTSFEYSNSFLGTQVTPVPVSYGRYQARADFYLNFIPRIVWYNSVRGGWLKNFVNPRNANGSLNPNITVPLIKQFALGGVNSLRGFQEQELNVQEYNSQATVQDYMTYVNYRTQIDFYASNSLSLGPFLDSGNLQVDSFSLGGLRYGTGLGLRYLTPIGPVNFDWGFKLFPRPGEDKDVFYFSLGVI